MAKRKKQIDIPESVCLFDAKEIAYIHQASKMIPWPVDVQLAQINVPFGSEQEAEEHLTVRHLVNKFGFAVQMTINCEVKGVFNPEMKVERKSEAIEPEEKPLIQRGTKFRNTRENRNESVFAETKDGYILMVIGVMTPNYPMKREAFEVALNHGIFKLI